MAQAPAASSRRPSSTVSCSVGRRRSLQQTGRFKFRRSVFTISSARSGSRRSDPRAPNLISYQRSLQHMDGDTLQTGGQLRFFRSTWAATLFRLAVYSGLLQHLSSDTLHAGGPLLAFVALGRQRSSSWWSAPGFCNTWMATPTRQHLAVWLRAHGHSAHCCGNDILSWPPACPGLIAEVDSASDIQYWWRAPRAFTRSLLV